MFKSISKFLSYKNHNEVEVMDEVVKEPTQEEMDEMVLKIHNEVDGLESKFEEEIRNLLSTLEIPVEDQVVKKGELMKSLGFSNNNEVVAQASSIRSKIDEANSLKLNKEKQLHTLNYYKHNYPLDKIVPFKDFEKVLIKYNLIYAPANNYIKDVPEKNVIEISKAKKLNENDAAMSLKVLDTIMVRCDDKSEAKFINKLLEENRSKFSNLPIGVFDISGIDFPNAYNGNYDTRSIMRYDSDKTKEIFPFLPKDLKTDCEFLLTFKNVNRNQLHIAAPKSHFDLSNLTSQDGMGFYEKIDVKIAVFVKDPIAFYLLKGVDGDNLGNDNLFVRIVSKWGTSDDQSYLDPIVQNENLN